MILSAFTIFHVALSLIGIGSGFLVVRDFLGSKLSPGLTQLFLITTAATSLTGFLFPFHGFTPGIGVGILSLIVLAIGIAALYRSKLAGGWRRTYVISAVIALYFNCFVLVVQLFQKVPALKELAPTQSEPPFAIAQAAVLALFVALGIAAVRKFRGEPAVLARSARA
jgi:hypothetical protein